ncbi:MAG: AMIN domain-containing protein, partial [Planktotalea sp.]|uniref:AMIN domain-containing protein n=1 Tax=Planktotalea sp. TaxID=2029877 RepID=UPI003C781381
MIRAASLSIALLIGASGQGAAQGFSALARLEADASRITTKGGAYQLDLALSQGVPYRVYTLDNPARLVVDFREVDFAGTDPKKLISGGKASQLRFGAVRPGWS